MLPVTLLKLPRGIFFPKPQFGSKVLLILTFIIDPKYRPAQYFRKLQQRLGRHDGSAVVD